jgi:hypothetical protein
MNSSTRSRHPSLDVRDGYTWPGLFTKRHPYSNRTKVHCFTLRLLGSIVPQKIFTWKRASAVRKEQLGENARICANCSNPCWRENFKTQQYIVFFCFIKNRKPRYQNIKEILEKCHKIFIIFFASKSPFYWGIRLNSQ